MFTPRAVEAGKDPKYSCSVLIKKTDPQVAQIQAIIDADKLNGWPSGFPATGKIFMKDSPENPEYVVINGNAQQDMKPPVVDANICPIIDPSQVYAGAIAWVSFNSFTYNKDVNKGVAAGLNGVMITGEEGELGRLDGRPTAESMFADVQGGGVPATTAPAPAAPNAPAPAAPGPPVPTPQYVMTAKAQFTRDQYLATPGWTDELLISEGLMLPPNGVAPSFA